MSRNIVFEGWLTKSPPSKRIWRTKWRRRWFALRQSGELPGQYFLDYFSDRNCRRLKGTINLDLCEQVDAGLHMERGNGVLAPKDRGSVFTIQTQTRIYHLEADCEADMEKWVDAICRVCGLRATENASDIIGPYQPNESPIPESESDSSEGHKVYIPISECVTGARTGQSENTFTFDNRATPRRVADSRSNVMYQSTVPTSTDLSENDSNLSEDENNMNSKEKNRSETKQLRDELRNKECKITIEEGPAVPPRPPKTRLTKALQKLNYPCPSSDSFEPMPGTSFSGHRRAAPPSPLQTLLHTRTSDDEEELSPGHQSTQYCNMGILFYPPAVDRALKPKPEVIYMQPMPSCSRVVYKKYQGEPRSDKLHYLELDLPQTSPTRPLYRSKGFHGRSDEPASVYKSVDIVKTEAFNSTRADAEAQRNQE